MSLRDIDCGESAADRRGRSGDGMAYHQRSQQSVQASRAAISTDEGQFVRADRGWRCIPGIVCSRRSDRDDAGFRRHASVH